MGTGTHGGFGDTNGAGSKKLPQSKRKTKNEKKVSLPQNDSQIKHIFGDRDGHLPDTPENRKALVDLANNSSKYVGKDSYGNSWNVEIDSSGRQTWVRYQNGVINNGGRNLSAKTWNPETGLNRRFNGRKGKKK